MALKWSQLTDQSLWASVIASLESIQFHSIQNLVAREVSD